MSDISHTKLLKYRDGEYTEAIMVDGGYCPSCRSESYHMAPIGEMCGREECPRCGDGTLLIDGDCHHFVSGWMQEPV